MQHLRDIFSLNMDQWVFHGSSNAIENNVLTPRANTTIADAAGSPMDKWVFAAEDPRYAILHAIKVGKSTNLISPFWSKDGQEYAFTVIENRPKFIEEFKGGQVFKLPRTEFIKVSPEFRFSFEWKSANEQKLHDENTYLIPDLETALSSGVQIFFLQDGLTKEDFDAMVKKATENRTEEFRSFDDFVKSPYLIWENRERGIYPIPAPAFIKA